MSAFRDYVPDALEILEAGREAPDSGISEEMQAHAGLGPIAEGWGDVPSAGPVGPRQLLPSPRPPSAVATDPIDPARQLRARQARLTHLRQSSMEDQQAIVKDPRVRSALGSAYRILQQMDRGAREHQAAIEGQRLQIAHLLSQALRDPMQAGKLREHIPALLQLLKAVQAGEPAQSFRELVSQALSEVEMIDSPKPPVGDLGAVLTFLGL